ncbi:aspartate ammonia-lyase [Aggregatilinea lenta]|uniref:aspartate ammonia-lyase n=1 Tax=Aggregatilinea lenta TaxID=913108 RepID=UPI000E5C4CE3|nr:aspartate ammonia-lyase [Aggregatilinea lenta]
MAEHQDFRTEKDSLGEIQVPAHALWGAQTQRAVQNFPISGMHPYPAFVWAQATIKRAAAQVNLALGQFKDRQIGDRTITGQQIAQAVMDAADEVIAGKWNDHFVVDPFQAGAGTSHNMNVNEVIANRANQMLGFEITDLAKPVSANDHVNMAQSTNDTIPTAIRLGCLWRLEELLDALADLQHAFEQKADEFDDVVKSGRTHLQDAVPVRLGQEFGAYAKAVERDTDKIELAAEGLRRLGIGGTATGTGLNAHPDYHRQMVRTLSDLTGLALYESDNLFESMQSMGDAVFFSGAIRTLAQDLARISNDIRLLSSGPSTGLDEIRLPAVQPGSSIMPGKVNPVLAEMMNMTMYHVMGNDFTVLMAGQAGQLELNVMMPIIAHNLFEMMHVTIGALKAYTTKMVAGIAANREKAEGWLAKNAILVTALNPIIGYLKGAEVAKKAMASNRSILDVVVELGYMTEDEAREALNPRAMTEGGIAEGA